jgi:galactofuranose transport system ATP-binding protein
MTTTPTCVLAARGISRGFPGVRALDNASLTLRAGEVHALMGQNGAGKSTLIKILTGVCEPDAGTIELDGKVIRPRSTLEAQTLGISTVYQEVNLCPNLSVAENIFAGRYPRKSWTRGGGIDWREVNRRAHELTRALDISIDVTQSLASYPVAIRQMIAVVRATSVDARVLILDEATSSLDDSEVQQLFALLAKLRDRNLAILFVTHFLEQVYAICDRITVLRGGQFVGEYLTAELPRGRLIAAMTGREDLATTVAASEGHAIEGVPVLAAKQLYRKAQVQHIDLEVRAGEIVGVAGLLGSGRTEVARLLFGLDRKDSGEIEIKGAATHFAGPADAIARGLALCPEERKTEGILADLSTRENMVLALQARKGLWKCLSRAEQTALAERYVTRLGVKVADLDAPIGTLSGGNQQKALLARSLAIQPQVLILDEPTRGVDVAAKQEIMDEIVALARAGIAVIFISAEIAEVLRIADRVVVMRDRRKAGELPAGSSEQRVYELIAQSA